VQVRGLIAERRSGLLDHPLAVRWRDRGALPGRGRTRPASNGIHGWHTSAIGEACLGRRTARPGRARPSVQPAETGSGPEPVSRGLRCRVPLHDRGLASRGRAGWGDSMTIGDIVVAPQPEGGVPAPGQTTSRRKHLTVAVWPDPSSRSCRE